MPLVLFIIAVAFALAANIWASNASWHVVDIAIIWSAIVFLVASFPLCIVPKRYLSRYGRLAIGGWAMMRFAGDLGDSHMSGGLLFLTLSLFTASLTMKTVVGRWTR